MIGWEGTEVNLILGLICLIMAAVTWMILAQHRSRAAVYWCWGNLLVGGGMLLGWHGAGIPDWSGWPLANLSTFTGLLCAVQVPRLELGRPWRPEGMAAASLGFLLVFGFIWRGIGNTTLCRGFVTFAWIVSMLQVSRWSWRLTGQEQSTGARTIAASQLLLALGLLVHLVHLIQVGARGETLAGTPLGLRLLGIVGGLTILASDVGFIGIFLERQVRQRLEAAAAQARQEERLLLGNQLAHLDRQRGFGLVAASLAHELNQPLTAILASAQAARRGIARNLLEPDHSLELLDKIILNARRLSGVTGRIRSLIRPGQSEPGPVDLEKLTRRMLDLVGDELRQHGIQVTFPAGAEPVLVQGNSTQLSQVLLNILRNAIEALLLVQERSLQIQLTQSAGVASLAIRDSGPGLDPEVADRAGSPYFTTKPDGLGLGLSISTAILEQHQGSLILRNAEGGGACLDIRLPLLGTGGALP